MAWETEESNIKFLNWGEKKPDLDKEQAVVVKKGEELQGIIKKISKDITPDGELTDVRYNLKTKDDDKEILVWCNASMLRQHKSLNIQEGDEIKLKYVDDYETNFGNKGRKITMAVKR
jgi:uncharacterized protein YbaA (DUF1428 family)